MPKNPDRPKIRYKHVKKPPPPRKTKEEIADANLAKTELRLGITPAIVNAAIARERGLLAPVCRSLRVARTTLLRYIDKHEECIEALLQARDTMGDVAEKKLFELVEAGDVRCLLFYLSTVQRHRGYALGNGGAIPDPDNSGHGPVYVETVNIVGIPSGTFLPKEIAAASQDNMVIDN